MSNEKFIGVFDDGELFEQAIHKIKDSNIEIEEVYMPVPLHHAIKDVSGGSKMPIAAYFYGLFAIIAIPSFLYYAAVISWPLNIGGKPSFTFPPFIIITLVLTIMTVTILSLITFIIRAKLYPGKKAIVYDDRAVDDKYIIVLNVDKVPDAENILRQNGANEVINKSL